MAKVFDKMASVSGFCQDDFDDFFDSLPALSPSEVAAVLGYLLGRLHGCDAAAMVAALRRRYPQRRVRTAGGRKTVNLVGTGGGPSTFNITTTAAFVVAAAGPVVIKTGSSARRSLSGFADVAARLGTVKLTMPWDEIETIADEVGIVFMPLSCYAPILGEFEQKLTLPVYCNAALYLGKLGPLLSPVKVDYRLFGANSTSCVEMLATACQTLGDVPTTLVSSEDGLDEVSSIARTTIVHLTASGGRQDESIDPRSLGISARSLNDLRGFKPAEAAQCCERILAGKGTAAQTEVVALNAAVVLTSLGARPDISAGFQLALELLSSGAAFGKLRQLRERVWKCAKL